MAIRSEAKVVGAAATLLADGAGSSAAAPITVEVQNPSTNANSVFVGGDDVTTANGVEVAPAGAPFVIDLAPGDDLYAIAAANTTVRLLRTKS